jgi:DNA-binding transcriptional ArsR family regulator
MMGVAPPAGREAPRAAETVLMNDTRLRIFRLLCNRPGAPVRQLGREAHIAPPSVLWHLGKLVGSGAVSRAELCGRTVYYPSGMVAPADLELLALLGDGARASAVRRVLESPGLAQAELSGGKGVSGRTLGGLASLGVLAVVRDGRHRRYYPAPAFLRKKGLYERRAGRFRRHLLALLEREGLSPEAERYNSTFLDVRVRLGTRPESLRLLCNPFALEARDGPLSP